MKVPIEEILTAYFEKRATPHEKLRIKEWLKEEGNEEIFYQCMAQWEASHLQFSPDEDKAFDAFHKFIHSDADATPRRFTKDSNSRFVPRIATRFISIAASVTILFCAAIYLVQEYYFHTTYSTGYGMTRNILLEDGSEITLNANSSLRVPRDLAQNNTREVWLTGEAFFSIAKRPDRARFTVYTENINIEVLGTKFNVNNRRGRTEVVLTEGSVKLTSPDLAAEPVFMKPGEYVSRREDEPVYNRQTVVPEAFTVWQSNKLIFEDTPLHSVVEKIEDYYGVEIVVENKALLERPLTGTLPNNDLGIVLKSLSTSHDIIIQRDGDHIIFR